MSIFKYKMRRNIYAIDHTFLVGCQSSVPEERGPLFSIEPPADVTFANTKGAQVVCAATGTPKPTVQWVLADGSLAFPVQDLRELDINNGILILKPFLAEQYRPDVHSVTYRCSVNNSVGVIVSNDVQVRGVVLQPYDVQVYDSFAIEGNTAVFKCQIPAVLADFITVSAWIKNDNLLIQSMGSQVSSEKYMVTPTGELHIAEVAVSESGSQYKCKTTHKLVNESVISKSSGRLYVNVPHGNVPTKMIDLHSTVDVLAGELALISCVAHGFPVPSIEWYRKHPNGRILKIGESGHYKFTKSSLVINAVEDSDEGSYVCEASSETGKDQAEIYLRINKALAVKIQPNHAVVKAKQSISFHCEVNGDPPKTFTWLHNGQRISQQTESVLVIPNVETSDRGMYQCMVEKNKHRAQAVAELRLSDISPQLVTIFEEIIMQPGGKVILECSASGMPLPGISWDIDGINVSRNSNGPKVLGIIKDGIATSSLTIENAKVEDGGLYTCSAGNPGGNVHHSARVNIFGSVKSRNVPNKVAVADSSAFLNCPYYGYPVDTITWHKDNELLPLSRKQRIFKNGTLVISQVQKSTDAGMYECSLGETGMRSKLGLDIIVPPQIIPFAFLDDQFYKGMRAHITCAVSQGDLPIAFEWLKDGHKIPFDLNVSIRNVDKHASSLNIENVGSDHSGNYTCAATNRAATALHTSQLLVRVPPQWILKPENGAVIAGADTIIHCKSQGYPKPITSWMFAQDIEFPPVEINSNDKYILFPNGSLLLRNIDAAHAGLYFCEASNGIGSGLSRMVKISIHAPPKCNNELLDMLTPVGQEYQLKCICEGDNPMSISWTKDGALISNSTSLSQYKIINTNLSKGFSSILYILNTSRLSRGSYTCSVVNAHGKSSTSYKLRILEKPEPPTDIRLNVPGSRTIELSWQKPSDGNDPIKKYIIEYITELEKWDQAERVETESGDILTGIISNLQPDTNYLFRMVAENRQGKSKMSPVIKGTTAAEPPSGVPMNVHIATNSDNMLTVTWNSPRSSVKHERITGYNIGYKEEGSQEPFSFKSLLTAESHLTTHSVHIPNLKKFAKYAIVVQAYNDQGKGPLSEPIVAMTSEGVPNSVPKDFRCTTLTSQRVHLAWGPVPAENINGILKGYKILCKAASGWYVLENEAIINVNATNTSATIGDLEKYTNYSFQISANTKAGEGPFSEPIYCRTLDDVPEAPADIKALVTSESSILISWRNPSRPNGIIRSFTVYYSEAGKRNDVTRNTLPAKTTQLEIPGLLKGHRYEFWVTATTMVGEGKTSTIVAQSPSASVAARIVPFDEKVVIPWKSDVSLSCQAVGKPAPERMWYHGDVVLHDNSQLQISLDGTLTIKSISEKDSGDFYCVASNYLNEDRVTYTVIVLVPPSPPTVEVLHTSFSSIEVKWKMTDVGSDKILGYILHVRQEFNNWEEIPLDPDVSSYRLNGLECGATYEIAMAAYNKIGLGDKSQPILVPTNGSAPGSPSKDDLIEETATSISINLNAWKVNGCPIQYFVVEYRVKGTGEWISVFTNVKPEQGRLVVRDLTPATWYGLRLTAHSSAGSSIAEYNFATVTLTGATISPDEMLQDQSNGSNVSGTFNIWIVVTIILSVLLLLGGVTFVCLYVQRKNGHIEGCQTDQAPRPSSLSTDSRHRSLVDTFSYAQHNTLGRPRTEFGTMSSAGYQSDPVPYATCQLGNTNFGTLPHHHMCPPVPPRNLEHFGSLELQHGIMLPNGGFMPASDGISEATFIFPKVESVLPNRYPHEDLSK